MTFDASMLADDGPGFVGLSRKAPRLVLADPLPAVDIGAIQYSILPARAIQDPRLNKRPHLLLLLAAICLHTSPAGICYPSQTRLAKLCGRSHPWVSRYIRDLEAYGYVKRLVSLSKRKRHAFRRIVIYDPGAPLPPLERPEPMPWAYPFSANQPQPKPEGKDNDMRMTTAEKDRVAGLRAAKLVEIKAEQDAWKVADHFANKFALLFETNVHSEISQPIAVRWLKLVDAKTAMAHIDRLLSTAKLKNPDLLPSVNLRDYPEPSPETAARA